MDIFVVLDLIPRLSRLVNIKKYSEIFIITDSVVEKHYFPEFKKNFPKVEKIVVSLGEKAKNIETIKTIWQKLLTYGCDRKSLIINLGGGAILDIGGFAAATYMRGVNFIQIPTTLLSQVDACVGGKVAVNFAGVKNLIGSFNQPVAVFCDINFLSTLPDREFISGFAEVIKHGLIADKKYFDFVTSKKPKAFSKEELVKIILGSIKIKAAIVNKDEKETGQRRLLNFGHTIGHAIEALSQDTTSPLLHGESISIGMVIEAKISRIGVDKIKQALTNAGLPTQLPDFPIEQILERIKSDKKSERGDIQWTLIESIGKAVINKSVNEKTLRKALERDL